MKKTTIVTAGFTLTELLVVLGLLALLPVILRPALNDTRQRAATIGCLNNSRQLALAWMMYANDQRGLLVNLSTYCSSQTSADDMKWAVEGVPWRCQAFGGANGPMVIYTLPADLKPGTSEAQRWIVDLSFRQPVSTPTTVIAGSLYPYDPSPNAVHCPGDTRYQLPSSPTYLGPAAWDSYSGGAYLNGEGRGDFQHEISKSTGIKHPSGRFVWAEGSDTRGENLGSWEMANVGTPADSFKDAVLADAPAAFHDNGAVFNFCDGHAERHGWFDPTTIAYAKDTSVSKQEGEDGTLTAAQHAGNVDAAWVGAHYANLANP